MGAVPDSVASVIDVLRPVCTLKVERAIYTSRQLRRAANKIDPEPWGSMAWGPNGGHGLTVMTDSRELLHLTTRCDCLAYTSPSSCGRAMSAPVGRKRRDTASPGRARDTRVSPSTATHALERSAKRSNGYSYVDVGDRAATGAGHVGAIPHALGVVIAELGRTCAIDVVRAVYTSRQLDRAANTIDPAFSGLVSWSRLPRGQGLKVVTDSARLLSSHAPLRLLGVHVAVKLQQGSPPRSGRPGL